MCRIVNSLIVLSCLALPASSRAMAADTPGHRNLTAEDVLDLTWVIAPEVSPDGRSVLYSVLRTQNGSRHTSIWLSDTSQGSEPRRVLSSMESPARVRWSPDSDRVAFLARGKNGIRQLYVADRNLDKPRHVTQIKRGITSFQWAPDSQSVAFTVVESNDANSDIEVVGKNQPRISLWTTGLRKDARPHRVSRPDQNIIAFAWSPDAKQFAILNSAPQAKNVAIVPGVLSIVNRTDGETVCILSENATEGGGISWSPDGSTIAASVYAPRRLSRRLALFPASGGDPSFPFAEYRATPMGPERWTSDSSHLFVRFTENTRNQLVRLNVASGRFDRVSDSLVNFWGCSVSDDGQVTAFAAESQHDPPDLFVCRNGQCHRLTDFNENLKDIGLGDVTTVKWTSSIDGRDIYGVLITPPGYQPGRPCPTIVNLHSGPHWLWWEGWVGTWLSWGQFLASHGYAVFLPNHRGSIGQGWEFAEAHYLEWGRGDYQDVMDGVEWLIEQKIADPERLGIGGSSFGGYLTAWTITQTDRFKASVVDAGWTDLVFSNLTTDAPEPLRVYLDGDELERREFFRSRSPLTFVENCRTPTLVLHGALDRRVPIDQGRAFHRALQLRGVETEMVIYRKEGHGLTRRANKLDAMRRIKAWFDRHLLD